MTAYVKGGKMTGFGIDGPASAEVRDGWQLEGKLIVDPVAMNATMLIPMEMGGMKGVKQVIDMRQGQVDPKRHRDQAARDVGDDRRVQVR